MNVSEVCYLAVCLLVRLSSECWFCPWQSLEQLLHKPSLAAGYKRMADYKDAIKKLIGMHVSLVAKDESQSASQ